MKKWTAEYAIAHHGILGQKWGKRNGPPYPLDAGDHSASERRAGWRKSLSKDSPSKKSGSKPSPEAESTKKGLTDKQKKWIKRGAIAAGVVLATYGTYKMASQDKLGSIGLKGANAVDKILGRNKGAGDFLNDIVDLSISSGFDMNKSQVSIAEACKKVNPGYLQGLDEYRNNCFSAVTADLFNRANNGQGLDVVARSATIDEIKQGGLSFSKILKPYSNASSDEIIIPKTRLENPKQETARMILSSCNGSDSYGILRVRSAKNSKVGHFIKYEVLNGEVFFSDSLSGQMGADKYFKGMTQGKIARAVEIARVDGLAVNPFELNKLVRKP